MPANKPQDWTSLWLLGLSVLLFFARLMFKSNLPSTEQIPYSDFQKYLDAGKVTKVIVSGDVITGELSDKLPSGTTSFRTNRVAPDLAVELSRRGVAYSAAPPAGGFSALLSWIIPPLIFLGAWWFIARSMGGGVGGGLLATGHSKAKLVAETDVDVTFDDVAGVDEAKAELHEIVDFLKRPEEFTRLGAHIPRGILLVRPPRYW